MAKTKVTIGLDVEFVHKIREQLVRDRQVFLANGLPDLNFTDLARLLLEKGLRVHQAHMRTLAGQIRVEAPLYHKPV